eukprot:11984987-Karenia_brevis.AAC.1
MKENGEEEQFQECDEEKNEEATPTKGRRWTNPKRDVKGVKKTNRSAKRSKSDSSGSTSSAKTRKEHVRRTTAGRAL